MAKKKSKTPINVQHSRVEPFIYNSTLVKVVDGDTIDVTLDLGKGKYGRILGIPHTEDGQNICQMLIDEGHAREYDGGKKTSWTD